MPDRSGASQALRTLQLNEARWQAILDTARDAVICIDERGIVTLFNRAAEAIFGYEAAEVVGYNVKMLMPPPYATEHDQYLERYRTTGTAQAIGRIREVHARRKTGEVFPIELAVSEARVGDEVIYSAIIRDMSERQAIQAELATARQLAQQRERLADIGAITARIVHDLGNPLAGVSMQAQLLLRRASRHPATPASSLRDPATRIVEEVGRLDHLIKDFLDFARQQRLDLRRIVLPPLLQRLVDLWHPIAAERDIVLGLEVVHEPAPLEADEEKLRRVLENLLKNAIEAIDRGPGRVDLRLSAPTVDRVRIVVEDDGPGVPASLQVFRMFETTKRDGSGLGLSIAKQIIAAHGGQIGFEPVMPHGAAFYVDLPTRSPYL
jgi:two-component system sensor kinase FixL